MGIRPFPLDLCVVSFFIIMRFRPLFHICCVLAFVLTLPLSVITATTGLLPTLNVISELIIGYALPGRPIAVMLFKLWGISTSLQAISFVSDFKLGHYMKIAHRPMFFCQVVATIVAGTVQLGVQAWMFSNIEGLCDADQKDGFICPLTAAFGNASIIVSKLVALAHLIRGSKMSCCSGVSLGLDDCFRTVSSTMASSSSSLLVSLHHCYSGYCTSISELASSSTSISQSPSAARAPCLLGPLLTSCSGCLSALSLTMSSVDATLTGGQRTTVSRFVMRRSDCFTFSDARLGYFRYLGHWIGRRLRSRCPHRLLYLAIPQKWHDWSEQHPEMVG